MNGTYNFDSSLETASPEVLTIFPDGTEQSPVTGNNEPEVLTAVVLTKCPVISYNRSSGILVYERYGKLIQTNAITDYDGSGFVEVE